MNDLIHEKKGKLVTLREKITKIAENTKSTATKRAYSSDFAHFIGWCTEHELDALPADEHTVSLYAVDCHERCLAASTIRRKLISINQAHQLAGHPTPVTPRVKELEKGIRRIIGTEQKKARPITRDLLYRMIHFSGGLQPNNIQDSLSIPQTAIGVRDTALIMIGWCGALRRSELVSLNFDDIETTTDGLVLHIRKSKTDQEGAGQKRGIPFLDSVTYRGQIPICPVDAYLRWIDLAGINTGPVFRSMGRRTSVRNLPPVPVSTRQISNIVKKLVRRAGMNPADYSGHSLRSGFATVAARRGVEERHIMRHTGHRSIPVMRGYIEDGELFQDHPLKTIFSWR